MGSRNEEKKNIITCDYCHGDMHYANDDFVAKIKTYPLIKCVKCSLKILRGGIAIQGYGVVNKMEQEVKVVKVKKSETAIAGINWANIDKLITDGALKVANLAKEMAVQPQDLKEAIVNHYGNRIEFRRGRSGGCFWVEATAPTTPVETTPIVSPTMNH